MSEISTRIHHLEEMANSITHGLGILLSVAGLTLLAVFSALNGSALHVVACVVFGTSLVLLYTASTLYHSFRHPQLKKVFKIIDHSCIYILIAGTYTPFLLITLSGPLGWTLFGIIWFLTVSGIALKIFFVFRFKIISTLAYVLMGWIIIFAIKPLSQTLPPAGIVWLVAGGLSYSFGVIFYAWRRLPFSHGVWHLFVIGGSICHFFAVLFHVIPSKG